MITIKIVNDITQIAFLFFKMPIKMPTIDKATNVSTI